ncbi:hypothetical protein [Bradyrhizobium sp. DOA9]|nr:hypothetical protein [Bradyrhizobium sp. DOA9]
MAFPLLALIGVPANGRLRLDLRQAGVWTVKEQEALLSLDFEV